MRDTTSCDPLQQKRVALGVSSAIAFVSLVILAVFWSQYVEAINCSYSLWPSTCQFSCVDSLVSPTGVGQCAYCPKSQGTGQANCAFSSSLGFGWGSQVTPPVPCSFVTGGATGLEQCNLCVYGSFTPPAGGNACSNLQGASNVQVALGSNVGLGVGIAFTIVFFISGITCILVMLYGCQKAHMDDRMPGQIITKAVTSAPGDVYRLTMGLAAPSSSATTASSATTGEASAAGASV